jgi:hypothetical protein
LICRNCNKRNICKYADIINSLPREITVNVVSCLFSSNKTEVAPEPVKTVSQPTYRQPIKYESDEVITSSEEEERIVIDINNINKEEKTISIFDYLTSEGENE